MADNTIFYNLLRNIAPNGNITIIRGAVDFLLKYAQQFDLTTANRVGHFIAQCAHETAGFKTLKEYWGPTEDQIRYEPGYKKGKDLGNIVKGDGLKFRGRGYLQTTGRANYKTVSREMFGDDRLLNNPDLLLVPEWGMLSSLYYWKRRNLNAIADKNDVLGVTKKINGGTYGIAERRMYTASMLSFLSLNPALIAGLKKKSFNVFDNNTNRVITDTAGSVDNTSFWDRVRNIFKR